MPHLLIRGIAPELIRSVGKPLTEELAAICGCPAGDFMLECLHTTSIADGEFAPSYPFIEIAWFDRGPEAQDRFAEAVDRHVRQSLGLPELEVAFRVYRARDYYSNGSSFGENAQAEAGAEVGAEAETAAKARADAEAGTEAGAQAKAAGAAEMARPADEELEELRAANRKLAEELQRTRKALASASGSSMSTRLRDALRE